jgi:protein disulfide-isomerase A1
VALAKVECDAEKELKKQNGVSSFPTVKFFRKGESMLYEGGRSAEEVVAFIERQISPVQRVGSLSDIDQSNDINVVAFLDESDALYALFLEAATRAIRAKFYVIAPSENQRGILALKQYDEPQVWFDNQGSVLDWVKQQSMPLIMKFSKNRVDELVAPRLPILFVYLNADDQQQVDLTLSSLLPVARAFQGKLVFTWLDLGEHRDAGIRLGLSGNVAPALCIDDMRYYGVHYAYDESAPLDAEHVAAWLNQFVENALSPTIVSEPVPEQSDSPVRALVGSNFEEIAFDRKLNVFVAFYADWCPHCKALMPVWEELAQHYASREDIVIGKANMMANDYPARLGVTNFPTLLFFPAGEKSKHFEYAFDRERQLDTLIAFVEKHIVRVHDDL